MNKKWIGGLAAAAMLFAAVPAYAAGTHGSPAAASRSAKQEKQAAQLKYWQGRAQKLGIAIDGKTVSELKKEIHAALQQKKAAQQQKITAQLQKRAAQLGIDTAGKTNQQLRDAIKQALQAKATARLHKIAAKLHINTDGKTNAQLREEIKAAYAAKKQAKQS
ncbi:hypothetical protein SD70_17365 [Gordoniibacillus kamchatkensis]|uniref:Uncharacterized protein n=1 Tax=Gordoniibacillus kamchatkensis TaxID=1590651 RepID=A0ABR5AGY7_9BACL|nr:hypothetical protein [Paenibacillus sp. VKM B-2647]KIL39835.1 hypothetical protein SD70_17365 [Paenibacillus sp. VKM B-2647]